MARASFSLEPPEARQRLVWGNRAVVKDENRRGKFQTLSEAHTWIGYCLPGMDEEERADLAAITTKMVWTPDPLPTRINGGRKTRDWDRLSERQRTRLSRHWAIRQASRRLGMTPRQYVEHGGDIRPVEARGYHERGFETYISRDSDEVVPAKRLKARGWGRYNKS